MRGRSGGRVEWMGTTIVETSGEAVATGASVIGGCGCWLPQEQTRNQKPETRRRRLAMRPFWFLVSGFWFTPLVSQCRMRPIRFFQRSHFIQRQLDLQRAEGLLELLHLRRADDRRGHTGLVEDPGEG